MPTKHKKKFEYIKRNPNKNLCRLINYEMDLLEEYLTFVDQFLRKELAHLTDNADNEAVRISEDEVSEFLDVYSDDYEKLNDVFQDILRSSLLVSVHSLLEYNLDLLLSINKRRYPIRKLTKEEKKGKNKIEQIVLSLQTAKGFDDAALSSWGEIKHIANIRNIVVHDDGILRDRQRNKEEKKIKKYIKESMSLGLDKLNNNEYRIKLKETYLPHVLKNIRLFFKELSNEL